MTPSEFGYGRMSAILVVFGAVWLAFGLLLSGVQAGAWTAFGILAVLLLLLAGAAIAEANARAPVDATALTAYWRRRGPAFRKVMWIEGLGLVAVLVLANVLQRPDWFSVGFSLVVGLHFLPLGRIFEVPVLYWAGSVMILADGIALAALAADPVGSERFVCLAAGAALWAAAAWLLGRVWRLRSGIAPRGRAIPE